MRLVVAGDDHRYQRHSRLLLPSGLAGAASNTFGVLRPAMTLRHLLNFPSTPARMRPSLFNSLQVVEPRTFRSSSFNRWVRFLSRLTFLRSFTRALSNS